VVNSLIIREPRLPRYWHARGYGLCGKSNYWQNVFSDGKESMNLSLKKGDSVRFAFSYLYVLGKISEEEINDLGWNSPV